MSKDISTDVVALADLIKTNTVEENGVFVVSDQKALTKAALDSAGSNEAEMKRVASARTNLVHASALALTELGSVRLKEDSDLTKCSISTKMGRDKVSAVYNREATYPAPDGGRGVKKGAVTASVSVGGIKGAEFTSIKQMGEKLMSEA